MSELDRIKKLSGILNEDYQYDMTDKGDMHDALGDVQNSMDDVSKIAQKAGNLARQVSDEIEKTLYTDESVQEAGIRDRLGYMSSEEYAREMLNGIKGAPKPGSAEYERMIDKLTDPSLGGGFEPGKGFPKADPNIDPSLGAGIGPKGFPKADPNADPSLGAGIGPKGFAKGSNKPDLYMKRPMRSEAVGDSAECFYDLQDEYCGEQCPSMPHKILIDELVRYLSGDQLQDFCDDFRRHHMDGMEESAVTEGGMKQADIEVQEWAEKYNTKTGVNGDELAHGWLQAMLNSGIMSDSYDQDEYIAFNEKYGYEDDMEWEEDDMDKFFAESPITRGMHDEANAIMKKYGIDEDNFNDILGHFESKDLNELKKLAGLEEMGTVDMDRYDRNKKTKLKLPLSPELERLKKLGVDLGKNEVPMPGGVRDPGYDPNYPYDKDPRRGIVDPELPKVRDPGYDPNYPGNKDPRRGIVDPRKDIKDMIDRIKDKPRDRDMYKFKWQGNQD